MYKKTNKDKNTNKLCKYKIQLILNKNLYLDNIITEDIYKIMETNLLAKINVVSKNLNV